MRVRLPIVVGLAACSLFGCQSHKTSADSDAGWPTKSPVIVANTGPPISHPPGASSQVMPRCTIGDTQTPNLQKAAPVDDWVTVKRLKQSTNEVELLLPSEYLPIRLAHMPAFAPHACIQSSVRHGDWSRVVVRVIKLQPSTLVTADSPTSWVGRPLVTLG